MVRFGIILTFILFTFYGLVDLYTFPSTYNELWLARVIVDICMIALFMYSFNKYYRKPKRLEF